MRFLLFYTFLLIVFSSYSQTPITPGLIINEWSNGPSGNKEYYELVVVGQCGESIDIRGYILDDNNGTFSNPADYNTTSTGIAPGHFRFSNDVQWSNIPVGSLIVVYNNDDINPSIPAPDPTDANTDSLYIVPHNHVLFERCTTLPKSTVPKDSTYTPCTYTVSPLNGWGPLSLRNVGGDAIQVRNPDGSYYHGVSYGGTVITGGPHNLKLFTGSGANMCGWFTDGDFFDVTNWDSGVILGNQTPGIPNNELNESWIKAIRDPFDTVCPIVMLPIEIIEFYGFNKEDVNNLHWSTASENNNDYFIIERSVDGEIWGEVSEVDGAGNSTEALNYKLIDRNYDNVVNYYKITQVDYDGQKESFEIISIDNRIVGKELIKIVNYIGQAVDENYKGFILFIYRDGSIVRKFVN